MSIGTYWPVTLSMQYQQKRVWIMVRKLITAAVIVGGLALTACNTVSGAGKDVSSAGRAVSGAAEDSK